MIYCRGQTGCIGYNAETSEATGEILLDSLAFHRNNNNNDSPMIPSTWTLIVLSKSHFFLSEEMTENSRLCDYPDEFLLHNVLLVDLNRRIGVARRKGVRKVLTETWGSYEFD